ncbi:MAG: hypothetical protein AAGF85_22520, partial [Bacteroidota bacterium]
MTAKIYIIVTLVSIVQVHAQQKAVNNPTLFGIRSHYGFIIPHSKELKDISQSNPWGIQVEWSK